MQGLSDFQAGAISRTHPYPLALFRTLAVHFASCALAVCFLPSLAVETSSPLSPPLHLQQRAWPVGDDGGISVEQMTSLHLFALNVSCLL